VLIDGVAPANPKAEQLVPPGALVEVRSQARAMARRASEAIARDRLEGYVRRA